MESKMQSGQSGVSSKSEEEIEELEKTLTLMFEEKHKDPRDVTTLSETSEYKLVAICLVCSNYPLIQLFMPNGDSEYEDSSLLLQLVNEDKQTYISETAKRILAHWENAPHGCWIVNDVGMDYEKEGEVFLFMNESDKIAVLKELDVFNEEVASKGYPPLSFDSERSMIGGELKPKCVRGGFFEKKRLRKENEWYDNRFTQLVDSLQPYLRRF